MFDDCIHLDGFNIFHVDSMILNTRNKTTVFPATICSQVVVPQFFVFCQVPGSDRAERCRSVPVSIIVADRPGNQGAGGQEIHGLMIVASDMRLRSRSGRWSAHAQAGTVSLPLRLPRYLNFWRLSCGFVFVKRKESALFIINNNKYFYISIQVYYITNFSSI